MTQFHAVMIDETGCEFGVSFESTDRASAYEWLSENYPESSVDQLEDQAQSRAREDRIYLAAARDYEGDYYYSGEDY